MLFNDGVALHRAAVVTDLLAQAVTQGGKPEVWVARGP